jgi:hypothetical protein
MGGSTERLNVVPIFVAQDDHATRATRTATRRFFSGSSDMLGSSLHEDQSDGVAEIRKRFNNFDAGQAKCFKLEEC